MSKDKNLPVCSPITQQKVLDFAKNYDTQILKLVSDKFKKRYTITYKIISGENADVLKETEEK